MSFVGVAEADSEDDEGGHLLPIGVAEGEDKGGEDDAGPAGEDRGGW